MRVWLRLAEDAPFDYEEIVYDGEVQENHSLIFDSRELDLLHPSESRDSLSFFLNFLPEELLPPPACAFSEHGKSCANFPFSISAAVQNRRGQAGVPRGAFFHRGDFGRLPRYGSAPRLMEKGSGFACNKARRQTAASPPPKPACRGTAAEMQAGRPSG